MRFHRRRAARATFGPDVRRGQAVCARGADRLEQDRRCDVLVVGAGITGALVAERLVREGRDVCIVDRERPGLGSAAASTAMLLWEIDRPLASLTDLYGFERAARAYRLSLQAVRGLQSLVERSARSPAGCARATPLYLAAGHDGRPVR